MNKKLSILVVMVLSVFISVGTVFADTLDLAKEYYGHNLIESAKELFITIIYDSKSTDSSKAEALYWLGHISYQEGRYATAIDDWNRLIKNHSQSSHAKEISNRLNQLNEVVSIIPSETVSSAVAKSYLSNGDFWSGNKESFFIDCSSLPKVEMAIEWYNRTIKEFPNSSTAEIAYQKKLFALLGWEEPGQDGNSYGVKADFKKYMPQVLSTFDEYERNFPNSFNLQAFRYQIAQVYWDKEDWGNTKLWLHRIIEEGKGEETFYTQTAKARINSVKNNRTN